MPGASARLNGLADIKASIWAQLALAVSGDKSHGWRLPVLATQAGGGPDARVIVLREADAQAGELHLYSDERAEKVKQIVRNPHGVLVFWSASLGWQLRCRVMLSIAMSGVSSSSRWARIRLTPGAQEYLAARAPGSALEDPGHAAQRATTPYFAAISAQVQSLDWLELHREGHRRAIFDDAGARWIQP